MDKTISISLGGFSFVVDELAYHKLSQYLQDIKISLSGTEGIDDIIEDVEIRIAELLRERTKFKEVVSTDDINHVISVMGHPDQYKVDEDYEEKVNPKSSYSSENHTDFTTRKKLFRDPDDKVISGLSAGIAHYLGLDPWAVRAVWLILLIIGMFTGFSALMVIVAYLLLLIFVPRAESTSDKLAMFGKPANLEQLKKNALEATESVANTGKQLSNSLGGVFSVLGRIILIFVGIFVLTIGLSFIVGGFSIYFISWFNVPVQFFNYFIDEKWISEVVMVLCSLLMIIPGILITILGVKMLWPSTKVNRTVIISSIILWFLTIIGLVIAGVSVARDYSDSVEFNKEIVLNNLTQDTIEFRFESNNRGNYKYKFFDSDERPFYDVNDELFITVDKNLEIRESPNNQFRLELQYEASGANGVEAKANLDAIKFNYNIKGNQLIFDDFLSAGKNATYRKQDVKIIVYVPKNKVFKVTPTVDHVTVIDRSSDSRDYLYNFHDNYFGYNGQKFVCLDCESNEEEDFDNQDFQIENDGDGVNINNQGVHIKSKTGEKVIIDQNQIHISDDTDTININYRNHKNNR